MFAVSDNLFFLTEWPCNQGREVTQADEGTEEQGKEDPWCEEGKVQVGNSYVHLYLYYLTNYIWCSNFADKGWRCQEEVRKEIIALPSSSYLPPAC